MPIGDVLRQLRQWQSFAGTGSKLSSPEHPSLRSASTSTKDAAARPTAQPSSSIPAATTTDRTAPARSGTSAPPDPSLAGPDESAPDAAIISLGTPRGKVPLEGWWDDDENDVPVELRTLQRGQLISFQLSPPGLGPIAVVMTFHNQSMRAQIVVDSDEVADNMTALLPQLRLSLTELFRVEDIRIVVRPPRVGGVAANPRHVVDMNA